MGLDEYLRPTEMIDSDHPAVRQLAQETAADCRDQAAAAARLFLVVRDRIRYDPYAPFFLPEHYRASATLGRGRSFCIPKAALLCALGRAVGIPSRLGFATVRSHLATRQLLEYLGSDLFVYHAYTEFLIDDRWVKATPAFNRELCERHRVEPLEFDGREDALFQPYNLDNNRYMEYLQHHGTYADVPLERILAAWREAYGEARVQAWIERFRGGGDAGAPAPDFGQEEVVCD